MKNRGKCSEMQCKQLTRLCWEASGLSVQWHRRVSFSSPHPVFIDIAGNRSSLLH